MDHGEDTVAAKDKRSSGSEDETGPGKIFYLVLGGLLLAGVAALYMARDGGGGGGEPQPVTASSVEADPEAGVALGPADAPITFKEFVDYQCPHCAQFASLTGKMIRQNFVRTDSARWILYDFPLGTFPNSVPAALAARCAGEQDRYWEMEEILFGRQQEWGNERNPRRTFVEYAERVGLDTDSFRECLEEQRHLDQVMASRRYGQQLGVNSTPTIIADETTLSARELSYESLAERIRDAWEERDAESERSEGTGG